MIQPQELRIGNYIEYNGEIIKLDGSLLCCYIQNELDYPFNEVPLTEEILLKFGFSSRGTFWLDLYLDEKTKFTLGWHPDGRIDFEISINKIYFDIIKTIKGWSFSDQVGYGKAWRSDPVVKSKLIAGTPEAEQIKNLMVTTRAALVGAGFEVFIR